MTTDFDIQLVFIIFTFFLWKEDSEFRSHHIQEIKTGKRK